MMCYKRGVAFLSATDVYKLRLKYIAVAYKHYFYHTHFSSCFIRSTIYKTPRIHKIYFRISFQQTFFSIFFSKVSLNFEFLQYDNWKATAVYLYLSAGDCCLSQMYSVQGLPQPHPILPTGQTASLLFLFP